MQRYSTGTEEKKSSLFVGDMIIFLARTINQRKMVRTNSRFKKLVASYNANVQNDQ